MSNQVKIKLTGAKNYYVAGVRYEKGVVYSVDETVADELLEKAIDGDEDNGFYFTLATKRDDDKPAVAPKASGDAKAAKSTSASAKPPKKAKKTVKVSGGKIEGLDDKDEEDDNGGDGDKAGAVEV